MALKAPAYRRLSPMVEKKRATNGSGRAANMRLFDICRFLAGLPASTSVT